MLSVIVTSYNSPQVLENCLESLTAQPEAGEIIVTDCSERDPSPELSRRYTAVRFEHFSDRRTVPQLRWAGAKLSAGDAIAVIEARSVPEKDWCAKLKRALESHPDAPVAGGPVAFGSSGTAFNWGLYFCEYGAFAPPVREGPAPELSAANLCYRRSDLEKASDLLDRGAWDTLLHERWSSQKRPLVLCSAAIRFQNTMDRWTAIRQRFWYGRGYAADRVAARGALLRIAYAGFTVLLPVLMVWRIGRRAAEKSMLREFLRAFAWVALLSSAWSCGECVGYLRGPAGEARIY
jgi:glycosyltransferase involved in cell wall biosynthesis